MSASTPPVVHRFAGLTLDLIRGALLSDKGREIPLRPKSFALLRFFVENSGRLITRDEIMRTIWPDVIVADDEINQCVSDIRRALGDQKQPILRTIRRRGYIFSTAADTRCSLPTTQNVNSETPISVPYLGVKTSIMPKHPLIVLPFENLSGNQNDNILALGIMEDLTTDLARLPTIAVVDQKAARGDLSRVINPKQTWHELDVRYLVDGSLRRIGNRLRIGSRLVHTQSSIFLCADRFDLDGSAVEKTYDEIVRRLVRLLKRALILAEVGTPASECIAGQSAFNDLVTQAWAWYYRPHTRFSRRAARSAFEQALEIDSSSIDARIGLAVVLGQILLDGHSESAKQDEMLIEELLQPAYEAAIDNPLAHIAMGNLRFYQVRLAAARAEFEAALVHDEGNEYALRRLGTTLLFMGLPASAIPVLEETIRLNPRDPNLWGSYWPLGQCKLLLGRVDESVDLLRRAIAARPQLHFLKLNLSAALGLRGDITEARTTLAEAIKLKPSVNTLENYRISTPWMANPSHWSSRDKTLNLGLRKAGMPDV